MAGESNALASLFPSSNIAVLVIFPSSVTLALSRNSSSVQLSTSFAKEICFNLYCPLAFRIASLYLYKRNILSGLVANFLFQAVQILAVGAVMAACEMRSLTEMRKKMYQKRIANPDVIPAKAGTRRQDGGRSFKCSRTDIQIFSLSI